jgi:muconolactone delta-isomerase
VDKTTREAVARDAKAETQRRIDDAKRAKEIAKVQEVAARRARMAAEKRVRDAAAASAKAARAENVLKADVSAHVWKKAGEYIDKGITDFDDIRNGIATDLGMPVAKVTAALAKSKRAKSLTDETADVSALGSKRQTLDHGAADAGDSKGAPGVA